MVSSANLDWYCFTRYERTLPISTARDVFKIECSNLYRKLSKTAEVELKKIEDAQLRKDLGMVNTIVQSSQDYLRAKNKLQWVKPTRIQAFASARLDFAIKAKQLIANSKKVISSD